MAIKYYDKYPQRWDSPSQDYPQGAFKNLSALGEQDGSYLEKDWLNDQAGFFGALLRNAEMTPNGLVDTAQQSQFYDALVQIAKKIATDNKPDLSEYFKKEDIAQEWGDSPDKVLSQEFVTINVRDQINSFLNVRKYNPANSTDVASSVFSNVNDMKLFYKNIHENGITMSLSDSLDYLAIQEADLDASKNGKKLLFDSGTFYVNKTIYKTSDWLGNGNTNAWDVNENQGTTITPFGTGNPKKWHDINDADEGIATVMITSCRSGLSISSITLYEPRTDLSAWDIGLHFPAVRRQNVDKVDVIGGWKSGAQYIDATWYVSNDTLNSLHPLIKADTGCNEYNISNSFVRGVRGLVIQGTTRDKSTPNFRWSNGGTSDINLYGMRFGTSGDVDLRKSIGCAFSHDAVMQNTVGSGQGINFANCTFRVASKYSYRLDHSNRINFINLYAETISSWSNANGNAVNSITSNTGDVTTTNNADGHRFLLDGELISNVSPDFMQLKVTKLDATGRFITPNLTLGGREDKEIKFISHERGGKSTFAFRDRSSGSVVDFFHLSASNVRPSVDGALNLGSSNFAFGTVFLKNQPNVVSDKRKKKDIVQISDVYMRIIERMNFKQFGVLHDDRTHFGILAQDWVEACEEEGVDPFESAVLHGSREDGYAVSYGELQNLFNAYILTKLK